MTNKSHKTQSWQQLYSVAEMVQRHGFLSEGQLRKLIFNSNTNGFDEVILRLGRKVLINEDKFFEWLDNKNQQNLDLGGASYE